MKLVKLTITALAAVSILASQSFAHSLWVNTHKSFTHPPGHMLTSLGWGHVVPMDQITDAESITFSTQYKAFAKSYVGIKEWTDPKPARFDLEIAQMVGALGSERRKEGQKSKKIEPDFVVHGENPSF